MRRFSDCSKDIPLKEAGPMERTVILHLMNNFHDASISRIVFRLVQHLGVADFDWHIGGLSSQGDMQDMFRSQGARIAAFPDGNDHPGSVTGRIREYVETHKVDIVHSHTPRTLFMACLALRRRSANRQVRHLATKHILNAPQDRRWGLLYTLFDRLTLYLPDHLVAVSRKIKNQISGTPGLSASRVTVIQNAIDCDSFCQSYLRDVCRAEFGVAADQLVIGSSGRLDLVKRYDLLLMAFSALLQRHPEARLMLVGDGVLRGELERMSEGLGISHAVLFTGFRQDIPRLLAAMDIYIMASANEGLSLSILEAMAAGKPVVITDVGGAREVVETGRTGLIIPPLSVDAIKEALLFLLESEVERRKLAQAGKEFVHKEYGVGKMMNEYRDLYGTICRGR